MHSDDITMGDLAYSEIQYQASRSKLLYERVDALENKIEELVEAINHLALHCNCQNLDDFPVKEA